MHRRQTVPRQWFIVTDEPALATLLNLRRRTGVLVLGRLLPAQMRRVRRTATLRGITVLREGRDGAARVHNLWELRAALLARTPLILLSPLYETRSHPEWKAIPPMRAAALARLAHRKLVALGGMDARRFARIKPLGFQGWAGISAFRT